MAPEVFVVAERVPAALVRRREVPVEVVPAVLAVVFFAFVAVDFFAGFALVPALVLAAGFFVPDFFVAGCVVAGAVDAAVGEATSAGSLAAPTKLS